MKSYRIDGSRVASKADLFTELGRAVNGDDGYFGSNLDALADCLRGGFGTPDDRKFRFEMTSYRHVKEVLGDDVWATLIGVFLQEGVDLWLTN